MAAALVGANDIATDDLGASQSAGEADEQDGPVAQPLRS